MGYFQKMYFIYNTCLLDFHNLNSPIFKFYGKQQLHIDF